MKIVVLSDIHGNLEALEAIKEPYDELWVLGDLVNYGPSPREVVDFIRRNATVVVRGNHDHAIGHGVAPRCSAPFRKIAKAMQAYSESVMSEGQKDFLRGLPLTAERLIEGRRFLLCHATPSDPLYKYCPLEDPQWATEVGSTSANVILAGHTHHAFQAQVQGCLVINPGSVGQSKQGVAEARYAVWENGRFALKSQPYNTAETVRKVLCLPVSSSVASLLAGVLRSGSSPV
jgi:protein phosphatase